MLNKLSIFTKIRYKLCRSIAKSNFLTSNARIFFLRQIGIGIGVDVTINDGFSLACDIGFEKNLVIEDRVAFGPNVILVLTSHPNHSKLRNLKDKLSFIEVYGNIIIKHDSWVGAGAIILPGVTINEYSIVGAGAVVTKDVPAYSVVAGVPAKIVRKIEITDVIQ